MPSNAGGNRENDHHGWHEANWGDIATLEYGKSLRGYQASTGPYRVYGTNGQIGWHTEPLCPHASVVIGRKGAYRGVHYSPEPFFTIDTAFYLKPKTEIDARWAYYQLLTQDINGMDSGSAIPSTSRDDFYVLPVTIPPLPEQRAIAHILGTLDDKIELNRRMNQTLEAMARAIFQDWFVDFGPVRAKMEGQAPYLPPELWDLFPEDLVDSELGEIPEGWDVKPLGEISKAVKGRSYKSSQLADSDTALVTLKSFGRGGGYQPEGLKSFIGNYKPEQVVNPGEVIVACTDVTQAGRVIGHPALVEPDPKYRCLVASLDTIIVRPFDGNIGREFLYFLCGTESFINHTSAHSTGTTVLHLSKNAIPSYKMALPTQELLTQFRRVANSFLELRMKNRLETYNLADQRDALIPKLMSGEVITGH